MTDTFTFTQTPATLDTLADTVISDRMNELAGHDLPLLRDVTPKKGLRDE